MILQTRQLSFTYGTTPVLENVEMQIRPGITALIGPNAAGKSTLLRCLCGLLKPRGEVILDGHTLAGFRADELACLFSYLPQDVPPRAALTVFETVLLGRLCKLSLRVSEDDVCRVERLLDDMGLGALASRYIGELSGGQVQMVAIAQALAREPAVLLMDEPTSSLDLRHQFEIGTLIKELTESRGMSTVMALHDLNMTASFADAVYVLHNGAVHSSGTPAEVLREDMIASVYRIAAHVALDDQSTPVVTMLGLFPPGLRRRPVAGPS